MREQIEETLRALNRERVKYVSLPGEQFKQGLRAEVMAILTDSIYMLEDLLKGER